jgi:hypothetical protein
MTDIKTGISGIVICLLVSDFVTPALALDGSSPRLIASVLCGGFTALIEW